MDKVYKTEKDRKGNEKYPHKERMESKRKCKFFNRFYA